MTKKLLLHLYLLKIFSNVLVNKKQKNIKFIRNVNIYANSLINKLKVRQFTKNIKYISDFNRIVFNCRKITFVLSNGNISNMRL